MAERRLTRDELLGGLSDTDPEVIASTFPAEWDWELHRAAQLVEVASNAKELTLEYWHALTVDEPYGNYDVQRDEAIRWALKNRGRFPRSRFSTADLPLESRDPTANVTSEASSALTPAEPDGTETPTAPTPCQITRRAKVDAYIAEVWQLKNKQLTRTDIWKSARYRTRTEFERWERCDPKATKTATARFEKILSEKPHLQ